MNTGTTAWRHHSWIADDEDGEILLVEMPDLSQEVVMNWDPNTGDLFIAAPAPGVITFAKADDTAVRLRNTGAAANSKDWTMGVVQASGNLLFRPRSDAGVVASTITFTRTGEINTSLFSTPSNTLGSVARFGTIEVTSYAVNNGVITENAYFESGVGWKRRAEGYVSGVRFSANRVQLISAQHGAAGSLFTETLTMTAAAGFVNIGMSESDIGTFGPTAKLHVGAGTTAPPFGTAAKMIYLTDSTQVDLLLRETTSGVAGGIYVDTSTVTLRAATAHPLHFVTNNAYRGQITSTGAFLWGTSISTGSVAGDITIGNAQNLRALNTSNTAVPLIQLNGNNRLSLFWNNNPLNLMNAATSTTATAGGGVALPGTVLGFLDAVLDNSTVIKVPYFAA